MTTPTEWDGADHHEAPYLPAAQPVTSGPAQPTATTEPAPSDAPYVPAPAPVAPAPVEPAKFDARAMVESQKNYQAAPAYGALPTGTEASREAAQKLRAKAQRKRRRNLLFGRVLAVLLLAGVGAAGWFGYQAYQDQQDRDAAERTARENDEPSGAEEAAAALTPLGEQQEIIEAMGDLNSTARATAGGFLGAVQDARDIVGETNGETDDVAEAGSDVAVVDPFTARSADFVYRRWDAAASTSPMVEYSYSYDRVADTYAGTIQVGATRTLVGTTVAHRFAIYPDGVVERIARSPASLDPAPDIALAKVFGHDDVIPTTARPYATLVDNKEGTSSGDVFGYTIDTEEWRNRDPGSFLAWVNTWHPRPADDPSFVDLAQREVSGDEVDTSNLRDQAPSAPLFADVERNLPGASVTFAIAADGHVAFAMIIDNTADFRTEYALGAVGNEPAQMDLGEQNWQPAP